MISKLRWVAFTDEIPQEKDHPGVFLVWMAGTDRWSFARISRGDVVHAGNGLRVLVDMWPYWARITTPGGSHDACECETVSAPVDS